MGTIPLPALGLQKPEDPLDQVAKGLSLQSMMEDRKLKQQQAALQQQQGAQGLRMGEQQIANAQQANQAGALSLQQQQEKIKDDKLLSQIYAKHVTRTASTDNTKAAPGGVDWDGIRNDAMAAGVTPDGMKSVDAAQKTQLEIADQYLTLDKKTKDKVQANNKAIWDAAETLRTVPENSPERTAAYQQAVANLQQQGVNTSQFPQETPSNEILDRLEHPLGMVEGAIKLANAKETLAKAKQDSDPILKLSTPQALSDPGAQASIQALIADPETKPEYIPRLKALLPKAEIAQNQLAIQKQREMRAQQAVNQGDPVQAGKLLADRTLTLDELKTRGSTPQFIANAVTEAKKVDPNFKAPNAAAQAAIAKSATNQQFFGNTDSLLIKGGTLDQLEAAGEALQGTKFPALNSIENWTKAANGSGPLAAYAVAALNVADDWSKVMSGGQGSDTSRLQALETISKNLGQGARNAAVNQLGTGVLSQRRGRVGTNPYMKDMYPEPVGKWAEGNGSPQAPASVASQSQGHKVGDIIVQNGKNFKATNVDEATGKVLAADPQ